MKDKDTPLKLVRMLDKMSSGIYEKLGQERDELAETWSWPEWCEMPIAVVTSFLISKAGLSAMNAGTIGAEVAACYLWRKNKAIFWFDDLLAQMLYAQSQDVKEQEEIPAEVLMKLPYPCVYIKAPDILEGMDGFWVWVNCDSMDESPELRMQWVFKSYEASAPMVLHILPGKSIMECMRDTFKPVHSVVKRFDETDFNDQEIKEVYKPAMIGVQFALYLAAENAEIVEVRGKAKRKAVPSEAREIKDEASEVSEYKVGVRMGRAIRKAMVYNEDKASGGKGGVSSGKKVAPHMRRGHWHHFWRGSMKGKRELILKWLPPIMVNAEGSNEARDIVIRVVGE